MLEIILRASAIVVVATTALLTSPTIFNQPANLEAYELKASNFDASRKQPIVIEAEIKGEKDNRALRLKKYLQSQGSPMAADATSLIKIADANGLDWRFLPAIAGVESTFGRFTPSGSHNAYGWHNGNYYFESWSAASEYVAEGIKQKWGSMGEIWVMM